jgi:hypothetical protein
VTSWARGAAGPSTKAGSSCLPKPSITLSRARLGFAAADFDRAGDQHLAPTPVAAGGNDDRVVVGRNGMIVSSASARPLSGLRASLP